LFQPGLRRLRRRGHLFPEGLLVLRLLELRFGGCEPLRGLVVLGPVIRERLRQAVELFVQVGGLVARGLRRNEGTGSVLGVLEGAMEPDRELPGDLECRECGAVIARQRMTCGISGASDLIEELNNLPR